MCVTDCLSEAASFVRSLSSLTIAPVFFHLERSPIVIAFLSVVLKRYETLLTPEVSPVDAARSRVMQSQFGLPDLSLASSSSSSSSTPSTAAFLSPAPYVPVPPSPVSQTPASIISSSKASTDLAKAWADLAEAWLTVFRWDTSQEVQLASLISSHLIFLSCFQVRVQLAPVALNYLAWAVRWMFVTDRSLPVALVDFLSHSF